MGLRRQNLVIALALTLSPLACRQTDDSQKAAEPVKKEAALPPERAEPVPRKTEPWFVGSFRGSIPLAELPPAPELRKKKKGAADTQPDPIPSESAQLAVTIDEAGLAHIVLTVPFQQETRAPLDGGELRARFVPTPERLGSGTIVLHRDGDSFSGLLSLLDPTRSRSLRGVVKPGALRKGQ